VARVHVVTLNTGDVRIEQAMFREWLALSEHRHDLVLRYSPGLGIERSASGDVKPWRGYDDLSALPTAPVTSNLNKVVAEFLADSVADFLLIIASDQCPQFNPLDFVEHDLDVLGWPTPSCRINAPDPVPWFPCKPEPGAGIVRTEVLGGGILLIARRVLEHPAMRAPFRFVYDERGCFKLGEDYNFCLRAREAGFALWCDLDHYSLHWKTAEMWRIWQWGTHNTTPR
jgi:hypothetical protein